MELGIPDLELARVAHTAMLTSDALQEFRRRNLGVLRRAEARLARDMKFSFASAGQLAATDYVAAARIRGRMAVHMRAVFARCDVLVSPTAPHGPPRLAHERCLSHMKVIASTMKFAQLGNLLGLPAVTVPCGVDCAGLPVGCAPCASPPRLCGVATLRMPLVATAPPVSLLRRGCALHACSAARARSAWHAHAACVCPAWVPLMRHRRCGDIHLHCLVCRLQVCGPAWHEASLLAISHALQVSLSTFQPHLETRQLIVNPLEELVSEKS